MSSPPQQDPYKALGISRDADLSAVKRAYRQLVLKCHPDKFQDDATKALKVDEFHKVQQAYDLLSDESKRAEHDERIKLYELRKEMGRGNQPLGKNVFDFEVRTAEPRSDSFKSKVYTQSPPRPHEDDVRSGSFEEPSRARARKTTSYEERKRPMTRDGEKAARRSEEERERDRWEKDAKRSAHGAAKKSRDKERKRGTEEKFRSSAGAYVEDDFSDDPYRSRSEKKSSREMEDDYRQRERSSREKAELSERAKKLDDHMNNATQYIGASRSKVQMDSEFRPTPIRRAETFHDTPYTVRYAAPSQQYADDDDSPRRSSASRSTPRRASDQIPTRSRDETRSSGRERRTSPYDDAYIVEASPSMKKPPLQSHSSAPPIVPVVSTSRKEPHRSKTMQPEYVRRESTTAPPPMMRSSTFQSGDKSSKPTGRGSKLKTQMAYVDDDSGSDSPAHYSSPRAITPPPRERRRERGREPETSTYKVENGRAIPISRHRTALREDDYGIDRERSESPRGTRRSSERPPMMRSSGSSAHTSSRSAQYFQGGHSSAPIIKEARPKLARESSGTGSSRNVPFYGEVNYSPSWGPEHVNFSKDQFRRGSDPSYHRNEYSNPISTR